MGGSKMSKSKGNLVAPAKYFDTSGADALRLFHLFVGPPGEDVDWNDQSDEVIEGCARFLQRVWRVADPESARPPAAQPLSGDALTKATHRLIARVSEDYDRWSYNTAVAGCMEFTNLLTRSGSDDEHAYAFAVDSLLLLLAPMAPHVTAELWERRHPGQHVHDQAWPQADPALAAVETATMVIQVNGKVRERMEVDVSVNADEMERLALESPKVQAALEGRRPRKVVTVLPKLVNVVA
jgi:leucyl-tRNA synthetase